MTPPADAAARTFFIDRLRVVLTVLVVVHHTAITYGGSGGWFYREVTDAAAPTSQLLTMLCAVNQAFFMGMFFLLAGYFTPPSYERKGALRFAGDRLLRLGVPLLVFGTVLGPVAAAIAATTRGLRFVEALPVIVQTRFVTGPLWFAWALLIFAAGYIAWRQWRGPAADAPQSTLPSDRSWLASALAVGAAALLIRQWVPTGREVLSLQLGYFASYVFLFALGIAAWPGRWLERLKRPQARRWRRVALLALPVLPLGIASWEALGHRATDVSGGWSVPAALYAFWEPFVAWGIIAALLWRFRTRHNQPDARWERWNRRAYGAFVLHAPLLTAIAVALRDWNAPAALKFAVVAVAATAASFSLSGLLLRLPGVRRVL